MKGSNETGVGGQMIDGNISANGTRVVDSDVVIAKIEKVTNQTGFLPSKNESAAIGTDTKVLKYAEAILKANQTPTADYLGDDLMSELKPIEAKDANGKPRNLTIQE